MNGGERAADRFGAGESCCAALWKRSAVFLKSMSRNSKANGSAPLVAEEKKEKSRKELVKELLAKIEKDINEEKTKVTVADYIRLTQLEKELEEQEQPREIIIRWSEPPERPSLER